MKEYLKKFYPESRFGGFVDIDATIAFYLRVNELLKPTDFVLDAGCGRGEYQNDPIRIRKNLRILKGKVAKVIGMDVDEDAKNNPFVDEFLKLSIGQQWPLGNEMVDLVISDWTLEHLEKPNEFFEEAFRVLKPNGMLCIRTINKWGYISLFSRLLPNNLHKRMLPKLQQNRDEQDVFPVYYRCNSIPLIKKYLNHNGFDSVVYGYESAPSYLNFSSLAYGAGVLYQMFAPKIFRNTILIFAMKTEKP